MLISKGGDPNTKVKSVTALMLAASKGSVEAVKVLLEADADPFAATYKGATALSLAQAAKHEAVVAVLKQAILPSDRAPSGVKKS
jgi:ankyrin repeat protein